MFEVPRVQYVEGRDGLIAFETVGEGPVDLLHVSGWAQTVEGIWDLPTAERFYRRLASFARVLLSTSAARASRTRFGPCTQVATSVPGLRRR